MDPDTQKSSSRYQKPFFNKLQLALVAGICLMLILLLLVLLKNKRQSSLSPAASHPQFTLPSQGEYVPDQLIVKFQEGKTPDELTGAVKEQLRHVFQQAGVTSHKREFTGNDPVLSRYYILYLQKGSDLQKAGNNLLTEGYIESVEVNSIMKFFGSVKAAVAVNDPDYSEQWDMTKIKMEEAWGITKGSSTVIAAVVDSGVDYNHEDLPKDIVKGFNYMTKTSDPMDDYGHGTHIAGTIGAVPNNNLGISGMNWQVKILAVKVGGADGLTTETGITGIKYAADMGAKVINVSWGEDKPSSCSSSEQDIINYATNKGATIVIAAGNSNKDASQYSPSNCTGNITVGASDEGDGRWSNSNYGSRVDIAAPGDNIFSTFLNDQYETMTGTSMAAPHVVGAVALLLAQNPSLTPAQVKDCLVKSADPIQTDKPIGPRLNAYKALQMCGSSSPTAPPVTVTQAPSAAPSTTLPSDTPSDMPSDTPSGMPSDGPISGEPSEPVTNPTFPVLGDCNADNSCPTTPPANPGDTGGGSSQCNIQINGQSFDCGSGMPGLGGGGGGIFSIFMLIAMLLQFLFGGFF